MPPPVAGPPPIKAAQPLKKLMADHFGELDEAAKTKSRPVAWLASVGPAELLLSLGFLIYYPENHGAMLGASRMATELIRQGLRHGIVVNEGKPLLTTDGHIGHQPAHRCRRAGRHTPRLPQLWKRRPRFQKRQEPWRAEGPPSIHLRPTAKHRQCTPHTPKTRRTSSGEHRRRLLHVWARAHQLGREWYIHR